MKSNTTRRAVLGAAVPAIAAGAMPAPASAVPGTPHPKLAALIARHAELMGQSRGLGDDEFCSLLHKSDEIADQIATFPSANYAELTLKTRFALTVLPAELLGDEMDDWLVQGILHDVLRLSGEAA